MPKPKKTKSTRYEQHLRDIEEFADEVAEAAPPYAKAVRQITRQARVERPKCTVLAIEMMQHAWKALVLEDMATCRVLLTAAYALVCPRAYDIFAEAAVKMFDVPKKGKTVAVPHKGGPLQIPSYNGLPPQLIKALNQALSCVDVEGLDEGVTHIPSAVGPLAILKISKIGVPDVKPHLN